MCRNDDDVAVFVFDVVDVVGNDDDVVVVVVVLHEGLDTLLRLPRLLLRSKHHRSRHLPQSLSF